VVRRALQRAEPDEPKDKKRGAWAGLLRALRTALHNYLHAERPEGEAWAWNTIDYIFTSSHLQYSEYPVMARFVLCDFFIKHNKTSINY
jgi:hypothetical protein